MGGPKYFVGGPKHFVGGTEKHYLSNLEKVSAKTFAVVSKCGRYEDYLGRFHFLEKNTYASIQYKTASEMLVASRILQTTTDCHILP